MIRRSFALARSIAQRLSAIGNHDFCPWANRYVYWLKQPIGWFVVAALAAGLTGAFVAPQAWFVCAVVLIVILMGTAWPWLAMRGLSAEIAFDRRRCQELDPVTVLLTVRNRWPWPVWGLLVERGFFHAQQEEGSETATALARVGGWSKSRFEFTYRPPRRGIFPSDTPVLATGFPFGLWLATQPIAVAEHLIAWPRCINLKSLPLLQGDRLAASGSFVDRPGHDGDILAARPYRHGDSLRRVHWAHTARRDTLIVCERQATSRRSVLVVLDRLAFAATTTEEEAAWDWGLRIVASLCREFHSHACELACELNGERSTVPPTTAGLHRLFDHLAAFQPEATRPAGRGFETTASHLRDRLTILVTSAKRWQATTSRTNGRRDRLALRAVVLETDSVGSFGGDACANATELRASRPWLRLNLAIDPTRQLQQQWERKCHDDWAS
jgi:uncharacterized protein (DUF58 family)